MPRPITDKAFRCSSSLYVPLFPPSISLKSKFFFLLLCSVFSLKAFFLPLPFQRPVVDYFFFYTAWVIDSAPMTDTCHYSSSEKRLWSFTCLGLNPGCNKFYLYDLTELLWRLNKLFEILLEAFFSCNVCLIKYLFCQKINMSFPKWTIYQTSLGEGHIMKHCRILCTKIVLTFTIIPISKDS